MLELEQDRPTITSDEYGKQGGTDSRPTQAGYLNRLALKDEFLPTSSHYFIFLAGSGAREDNRPDCVGEVCRSR